MDHESSSDEDPPDPPEVKGPPAEVEDTPEARALHQARQPGYATTPDKTLVNKNLREAWRVHRTHQMCYIFDFVTPARQWKRNTVYSEDDPWAKYGRGPPWADVTETDEKEHSQQPYFPVDYT